MFDPAGPFWPGTRHRRFVATLDAGVWAPKTNERPTRKHWDLDTTPDLNLEPTPAPLSLTEEVAAKLRDLIIRGQLKPGQHVVERKLCAELDVSRTPMREALKLLRQDGLVEIFRNRGARVTPYSADDAINLFEVISGLESLAAARAAVRISGPELSDLKRLHDDMLYHHAHENLDDYFALNSAVHEAVVRIADNPILAASRSRLMMLAQRGRYMAIFNRDRWDQSVSEHEELMTALDARDADLASQVWERHLLNTGRSVNAALKAKAET